MPDTLVLVPGTHVETIQFRAMPGITGTGSLSLPVANTAWLTATESGWSVSVTAITFSDWHIYLPLTLCGD